MKKSRILIVEDELIVLRDIRQQLQELGYDLVGETDRAEEAIELAVQLQPDLVLMDIRLVGEMDGVTAAQTIRERHGIPVVFLTALVDESTVGRAKLAEPFGYIIKPFDERQLHTVIEIAIYRHQAEARQLAAAEEQSAILRTAQDGFWVTDLTGRIVEVNEAVCAMHGYSREEMLQMSVPSFEVDETPVEIAGQFDLLICQTVGRMERRHRRKDGKIVNLEISMSYRPALGGRVIAFLRDVTERKRAERLVQARLRLSVSSATCSLEELLQKTLDEAEALTDSVIGFFHFVHADQKTILLQAWSTNTLAKMCTAEGKGRHYDAAQGGVWLDSLRERRPVMHNDYATLAHRQGLPTGHAPIVRELVVPVIRNGLVTAIIGVGNKPQDYDERDVQMMVAVADFCWDIVGRKQADMARQQEEANIEALLNAATESVFLIDRNGTILTANEVAARRVNRSRAEFVGTCAYDLHPTELAGSRRVEIEHVFATGEPRRFIDQRAGRWMDQNLVPIRDARGEVSRIAVFATDITESRQAADEFRREQERFNNIFRMAPVGIATTIDRVFRETNDAFCGLTGYPREELLGQNVRMLYVTEVEYQEQGDTMRREIAEHGHSSVETRWRRKDGSIIDVQISGSRLSSGVDSRGIIAVALDITDRTKSSQALRKSEGRLRQAQKILGLGVWDWDIATDRTVWSGEMFSIYGITAETFTGRGQDYVTFTHPEDRAIQMANLQGAMERAAASESPPAPEPRQFRIVRPDGSIRWVEGDAEVVLNQAREPVAVVGTLIDITERRRIEESLRSKEEWFRLIFNLSGDAMTVWELKPDGTPGQFVEVNDVACERLGYTRAKFLQGSPLDLQSPESALVAAGNIRQLADGEAVLVELEYMGNAGRRFQVEVSARTFERNGRRLVMSASRDISARKALEAQYRQAQKMEVIGQLAGGVAHDFNNILTVMLMDLEMLRLACPTPESATPIDELLVMAKRAATLTQQLLMFARKQPLHPARLELNAALSALAKMLRRVLGEPISLKFVIGEPALWIDADAGTLDQAILNLCINARDAMPHGGALTIRTALVEFDAQSVPAVPEARPGRFACLSVTDTGIGMNAEILQHMFEPFFTTKEVGHGTGLGLASVYGIVHQHHGWVNAESVEGQGTAFRIYLPCSSAIEPAALGQAEFPAMSGGTETILLAEDDAILRDLSTMVLRKLGYNVLPASTAQEALQIWSESPKAIDLLLTDMVMPGGMNGLQLSETLRRMKPSLRVVLMSGYSGKLSKTEIPSGVGQAFLAKPFEVRDLGRAIRRCLDGDPGSALRN